MYIYIFISLHIQGSKGQNNKGVGVPMAEPMPFWTICLVLNIDSCLQKLIRTV